MPSIFYFTLLNINRGFALLGSFLFLLSMIPILHLKLILSLHTMIFFVVLSNYFLIKFVYQKKIFDFYLAFLTSVMLLFTRFDGAFIFLGQVLILSYYLFKTELAAFEGNNLESNKQQEKFIKAVSNENYGSIYTTHLIKIYSETQPKKALELAMQEVANRATAETYLLLAYAHLRSGNKEKALEILSNFVENKSFNPEVWYYSSMIYKANGMDDKVKEFKSKIEDAAFELGPLLVQ